MPMVLIAVSIGILVIVPWMAFVAGGLGRSSDDTEEDEAFYAADAGIQAVVKDLIKGVDALDPSYTLPSVTVNDLQPSLAVTAPPRSNALPYAPVLIDPETTSGFFTVAPGGTFTYQLNDVLPAEPFQVNWSFSPAGPWAIDIFQGAGQPGSTVRRDGHRAPGQRHPLRRPGVWRRLHRPLHERLGRDGDDGGVQLLGRLGRHVAPGRGLQGLPHHLDGGPDDPGRRSPAVPGDEPDHALCPHLLVPGRVSPGRQPDFPARRHMKKAGTRAIRHTAIATKKSSWKKVSPAFTTSNW